MNNEEAIRRKYNKLYQTFNERQKRLWAASEAINLGHGGVSLLQRITGLSRSTIHLGIKELKGEIQEKKSQKSNPNKFVEQVLVEKPLKMMIPTTN